MIVLNYSRDRVYFYKLFEFATSEADKHLSEGPTGNVPRRF